MKGNKIVLLFLLVLVVATVLGMVSDNNVYWQVYNYFTILGSVLCGVILIKQKN